MWLLLLSLSTRIPLGCRVCAFGLVPSNPIPGYSGCLCLTSWPRDAVDLAPRAAGSISHGEKRGEGTRDSCCREAGWVLLPFNVNTEGHLIWVSGRAVDFPVNY